MADKVIAIPGVGNVAFPDTMSDDDIGKAIQAQTQPAPNAGLAPPASGVPYALQKNPPTFFPGSCHVLTDTTR